MPDPDHTAAAPIGPRPDVRIVQLTGPTFDSLARGDLAAANATSPVPLTDYLAGPERRGLWRRRSGQVAADPGSAAWVTGVIWDRQRSLAVGTAGYHGPPDAAGMVEIGYAVDPAQRRRGYARAALESLLARAAREPLVHVVRVSIAPDNTVSYRLASQYGFVRVGEQWDDEDGLEIIYEIPARLAGLPEDRMPIWDILRPFMERRKTVNETETPAATVGVPDFPMPRAAGCPLDPAPLLRRMRDETPITRVRWWDGSTPWLVTRYEDQRALFTDPRISADSAHPNFPASTPGFKEFQRPGRPFIRLDDPEHARLRRMVTAPFSVKRSEALRPAIQAIVDRLIDELLAGPNPADLVGAFATAVPSLVICELLGAPYADHVFFQDNGKQVIRHEETGAGATAAQSRLSDYMVRLMDEKGTNPGDDVLSDLSARVRAGELTMDDAARTAVLLIVAGHDTTANMISLGTLTLLEHPDQLAELRETDDPVVIADAVEELLRYLSIVHNGRPRLALADIEIGGRLIRAGDGVVLPVETANRDAAAFPDPDRLDLSRPARHHMAFAFGPHQCLGQNLARVELQVVYGTLYRRVPTLRLATDIERIAFRTDAIVYGVNELPVTW